MKLEALHTYYVHIHLLHTQNVLGQESAGVRQNEEVVLCSHVAQARPKTEVMITGLEQGGIIPGDLLRILLQQGTMYIHTYTLV